MEAHDLEDSNYTQWSITRFSTRLFVDRLELDNPSSKTDPFRKGDTLRIVAPDDAACAVAFLKNMFTIAPARQTEPLFIGEGAFSGKRITDILRVKLLSLRYGDHYASHCFRRGAVTDARNAGVPEAMI